MKKYQWTVNTVFDTRGSKGIGDKLMFSRIPEYYYTKFGKPARFLTDDTKKIYEHIPHIEIVTEILPTDIICPLSKIKHAPAAVGSVLFSIMNYHIAEFEDKNVKPKFCTPTEVAVKPKTICFSNSNNPSCPSHRRTFIEPEVLLSVITILEGWSIIQIGGTADPKVNHLSVIDKRGLSIEDTLDVMKGCTHFLGVNSGMMHLANCLDSLKKIIYVHEPVTLPIGVYADDFQENRWLYNDNTFVGKTAMLNVQNILEFFAVLNKKEDSKPLRVVLGCGTKTKEGWLNVDIRDLPCVDKVANMTDLSFLKDASVTEIYMEDSLEHLCMEDVRTTLGECHRVLVKGGWLCIKVPDARKHCQLLVSGKWDFEKFNYQFFGGQDYEHNQHRASFDENYFRELFKDMFLIDKVKHIKTPTTFNLQVIARKIESK